MSHHNDFVPTHGIYAVYGETELAYMQPFFVKTKGLAIRAFSDLANDSKTLVGQYPTEFKLFRLAGFCEVTGEIRPLDHPELLGSAADFLRAEPKEA